MNAYDAALKTADLFEQRPELYKFENNKIPDCGTPGCMVGHMGQFMGLEVGSSCWGDSAKQIVGTDSVIFMAQMAVIGKERGAFPALYVKDAVKCLRIYAERHLKSREQPKPDWNAIATAGNAYRPVGVVCHEARFTRSR